MLKIFLLPFIFASFGIHAQTVTVDIGHYLKSLGTASAYGEYEFFYNKELAQVVSNELSLAGYKINLQGFYGDLSNLETRAKMAQNSNLFISIHHDAIQAQDLTKWNYNGTTQLYNDEVKGFGIFVSNKNPRFKESLFCAKQIAFQLIKSGFTANYYHNKNIPNEKKPLLDKVLPVYQYDNLIVLKTNTVPAILIEAGVITNRQEAQWIKQNDVRKAFSQAVSVGVKKCLNF